MIQSGLNAKKRLHFGILLTTIDNDYLYSIWEGIYNYAELNDIHLTAFFGVYQSSDEDVAFHVETCFDAIKNNDSLDGLIVFTGLLAKHIGTLRLETFITELQKTMPVVSVSFPMHGIPSVLVDNKAGIYSAVDHLIKEHGKKNIVFIKGPDDHPEAIARLDGYKNALTDNGIMIDEKYIFPGTFNRQSGRNAVTDLIDNRNIIYDSVVACDDETAIGVLSLLKERKIAVPGDVAVVGFNDDRSSANFIPSLSTVRQGFTDIGMISAGTLKKAVGGAKPEDITFVTPRFVPRQSCGCHEIIHAYKLSEINPEYKPNENDTVSSYLMRNLSNLLNKKASPQTVQGWITDLINVLKIKPFQRENFLNTFDGVLVSYRDHSDNFTLWYQALNIISAGVEVFMEKNDSFNMILSTLFYATTLVYDIRLKEEKTKEFHLSDTRVILRRIVNAIIATFDVESLTEELYTLFSELSLDTTLIGLYRTPVKSNDPDADRSVDILIGFDGDHKINNISTSENRFMMYDYSAIENFDFERERRTVFFLPLYFKDEEAGVLLISYNKQTPVEAYETLRINISTAIKGAELMSKIQTLSITDDLTGLLNRRGFFRLAFHKIDTLSRTGDAVPVVLFMDLDGLKKINDTYGHKEGDIALKVFADLLKKTLRKDDIIGRFGGDEFVVFSSVKPDNNGKHLILRIQDEIEKYNLKKLHPYRISTSIGSVVLADTTIECFEAAIQSADSVLYEEKLEKKEKGLARKE